MESMVYSTVETWTPIPANSSLAPVSSNVAGTAGCLAVAMSDIVKFCSDYNGISVPSKYSNLGRTVEQVHP
jgi:hypothetical protein